MKTSTSELSPGASGTSALARPSRNLRLRSNRLVLAGSFGERVRASIEQAGVGELAARVLDVSIHGVRLALDTSRDESRTILLGDRLEPLTISCEGAIVYRGAGTVIRTSERLDQLELGVALEHAAIDLAELHRLHARKDAAQRWARARESASTQVSPSFRAFVAELANYLETAKSFLDAEESALGSCDAYERETVSNELLATVARDLSAHLADSAQGLAQLVDDLPKEQHARHRAFFESQVGRYFDCSPFLQRAKRKPLGYAGDYEMMNMLYRDHREGATLFGKAINVYATEQASARANINRIAYLGAQIQRTLERTPTARVRIASIGCGPAREIFSFLTQHPELGARLDIALIDQEERAIAHCERTLAPLAARTNARLRVIKESARRLLTDRKLGQALGTCDLIYSAGLFDYLTDRSFSALLTVLYGALHEGGRVVVGNVAAHNPDRWTLEYLAEWYLHHRSSEELIALASDLAPIPRAVSVDAEPSGVNLFLHVER